MDQVWLEAAKQIPALVVLCIGVYWFLRYTSHQADKSEERIIALAKLYEDRIEELRKEWERRDLERADRVTTAFRDAIAVTAENTRMLGTLSAYLQLVIERNKKDA